MSEPIDLKQALALQQQWLEYFSSSGEQVIGCKVGTDYHLPLQGPHDTVPGETVPTKPIGSVYLESNNPSNKCGNDAVTLYIKTSDRDGYQCWKDIAPLCRSTGKTALAPQSKLANFTAITDDQKENLNQLISKFRSSLASTQQNFILGIGDVLVSSLNLGVATLFLGLTGSHEISVQSDPMILAGGSSSRTGSSYQAQ